VIRTLFRSCFSAVLASQPRQRTGAAYGAEVTLLGRDYSAGRSCARGSPGHPTAGLAQRGVGSWRAALEAVGGAPDLIERVERERPPGAVR
jgi:hypothetical protein